jgi:hypothetical protein
MKTTHLRIEASAPANVRPSSGSKTSNSEQLHRIDFRLRFQNRGLSTAQVIDMLYRETPRFWELCQVVGKWVWVEFHQKQPRNVTARCRSLDSIGTGDGRFGSIRAASSAPALGLTPARSIPPSTRRISRKGAPTMKRNRRRLPIPQHEFFNL